MKSGDRVKFSFAKKEMEGTVKKYRENRLYKSGYAPSERQDSQKKSQRHKDVSGNI